MIKLYQFVTTFDLPNLSPFCMKLECFLRMTCLDYEVVSVDTAAKGPKCKAPYIEDGEVRLGDSELIIQYLQEKFDIDLDQVLTPKQRSESLALQRLMDDHLFWTIYYSRWLDDRGWPAIKEFFFGDLPAPVAAFYSARARKVARRDLYTQGMGRHSAAEVYAFAAQDIRALADHLGDKPFMHGNQPTHVDGCAVAYIANILKPPMPLPIKDEAYIYPTLRKYCNRMMHRYFGADANYV